MDDLKFFIGSITGKVVSLLTNVYMRPEKVTAEYNSYDLGEESVTGIVNIIFVDPRFFDVIPAGIESGGAKLLDLNGVFLISHEELIFPNINNWYEAPLSQMMLYINEHKPVLDDIRGVFLKQYNMDEQTLEAYIRQIKIDAFENSLALLVDQINLPNAETESSIKNKIQTLQNNIASHRMSIMNDSAAIDKLLFDFHNYDPTIEKKKIIDEIRNIQAHKKVDLISYVDEVIQIDTIPLRLYEPEAKQYYLLGRMRIKLPVVKGRNIIFSCLDGNRSAFWSNSPHPHVNSSGTACWGNIDAQIADMMRTNQFYGLFLTCLNYLETCNVHDSAGASIRYWTKIDENWNPITDTPQSNMVGCSLCDRRIPASQAYECDICGALVCDDCFEEIDEDVVCNSCIDDHYRRCEYCGDLHRHEEMVGHNGNWYCEEHLPPIQAPPTPIQVTPSIITG